jgi:hypothetical protein
MKDESKREKAKGKRGSGEWVPETSPLKVI